MQDATITRCLAYRRVATSEPQTAGSSLDGQKQVLAQFAAGVHARVLLDFAEIAGGTGAGRAEQERLLDAVRPGDIVAVSTLDRLARDPRLAIHSVRAVLSKGARFVSIAEGEFDRSPEGELKLSILAAIAPKG